MKRRLTALLLLVLLCLPLTARQQQKFVQCHLVRPV